MSGDWLATSEALRHVTAIEMSPAVSREKIVREIRRGTLPTKATRYSTGSVDELDYFLSSDELRHGNVHVAVDFEAGSAVITFFNHAMGHPPYGIHKAAGLVVSKRHLYSIWPESAVPDRKDRLNPKRQSAVEALEALYGSIEKSRLIPAGMREEKVADWLKSNKRAPVDSKTIQRALRDKRDK